MSRVDLSGMSQLEVVLRIDDDRQRLVARHRAAAEQHFDRTAPKQDVWYGELKQNHLESISELLQEIPTDLEILDAACGAGRHFGVLGASGHRVFGVDQSARMLELAGEKWPDVPTRRLRLQELAGATDLRGRFGGLICTDALEWVLREDWPIVLRGFAAVLKPASVAYLTVELPDEQDWQMREAGVSPEVRPDELPMCAHSITSLLWRRFWTG